MAEAITLSDAKKILLPSDRCNIDVVSTPRLLNMNELIKELVDRVGEELV
jgi:hypothetical protein